MQTMESPRRFPDQSAANAEITEVIERCSIAKKGVVSNLTWAMTRSGVVELTGATDSLLARRRTAEVALAARGVVNELVVNGPDVTGAKLNKRIRTDFASLSSLYGQGIEVTAENDRVTLSGTVDTWLKRQLATREAYKLGARDVNNHLQVHPTAQPKAALSVPH